MGSAQRPLPNKTPDQLFVPEYRFKAYQWREMSYSQEYKHKKGKVKR